MKLSEIAMLIFYIVWFAWALILITGAWFGVMWLYHQL